MACLQAGKFSSKHLLSEDSLANFSAYRFNYFPPTFKYEPSTAAAHTSKPKSISTQFKLQTRLAEVAENRINAGSTRIQVHSVTLKKKDEVDYFMEKGNLSYDCKQIHGRFVKLGVLKSDVTVGNKLAMVYLKSETSLDDARQLFDEIPQRTLPLYAALIGSYCRAEKWEEVFYALGLMVRDGMMPNKYLVPTILKACGAVQLLMFGKMIHGHVVKELGTDLFIGNALIDFYANCGYLGTSRSVFGEMPNKDVVSWTALVSAYMDEGLPFEAYDIFCSMQSNGVKPDLISWNALVSGFARNGEIHLALCFLEEMQKEGLNPRVTSWNGFISGCVHSGYFDEALSAYSRMIFSSIKPNVKTIVSILPACAGLKALRVAEAVHGYAIKCGLCGNIYIQGSLIDMYAKCSQNDHMENVFKQVKNKNTAIWNEMIAAYVNEGKIEVALGFLESMKKGGILPDEITYNTLLAGHARTGNKTEAYALMCEMVRMNLKPNTISFNVVISGFQQCGLSLEALKLFRIMQSPSIYFSAKEVDLAPTPSNPVTVTSALAACADLSILRQGKEIHGYIIKNDFQQNIFVSSALVDMYGKCHNMSSATKVFNQIKNRNTVAWNSLISAHINDSHPEEALKLIIAMLSEGTCPSLITFMILLPACGDIAALRVGRSLHGFILKTHFNDLNNSLAGTLIDMYARCKSISDAILLFDVIIQKDVGLWNVMIYAYSVNGMAKNSMALFEQMKLSGIVPDRGTFAALLSACVRDGSVAEAKKYFELMEKCYGISPDMEHYTCMVSTMAAAGLLDEALRFIEQMPRIPDESLWVKLLQVCRAHRNPGLGEAAEKAIFNLQPDKASKYVFLSNIPPYSR